MTHRTNITSDLRLGAASSTAPRLPERLLGVWAHPDDEAYLASGLMSRVVAAGGEVTLVVITDGEMGFAEDDARERHVRARQRRSEMLDAMSMIGVRDVRFLGVPDGAVADQPIADLSALIAAAIIEVRPDVVTTFGPDGVTGHPDHVACSEAATMAWLTSGLGDLWYAAKTIQWLTEWRDLHDELGIWMTEEPTGYESADLTTVVDLAVGELDRKRRVLAGHGSQTDAVAAAFGEQAYRAWICQESFRRPTDHELFEVDAAMCIANWCHPRRPVLLEDVMGVDAELAVAPDRCTQYVTTGARRAFAAA